ncbi:hypothetical protein ACRYI5_04250 [Furfurilactobacillus sp. WILCCON 0119]|uniref:hypothetical protein n=1 Tax=Furfurilactobacillus entadae TaxID=2922307 RepID=UPI0035EC1194
MEDQSAWIIDQLTALKTPANEVVIEAAIERLKTQQDEIDSLRGAMEGTLWSPKQWRK